MNVEKIKIGRTYPYESRTVPLAEGAKGKVMEIYGGKTGHWVTLVDKERGKTVTVRPGQVAP